MSNLQITTLTIALGICILPAQIKATTHTIDILELPNGGGTRAVSDGSIVNTFPGSETISFGENENDGAYIPQIINVNLYDDPAHTLVSDRFTITVPTQNPDQITVGLTSATPGIALQPLSPENIGITEAGGLQVITTLTNARGNQTIIRLQSIEEPETTPVPEPSFFAPGSIALIGLFGLNLAATRRGKLRYARAPLPVKRG